MKFLLGLSLLVLVTLVCVEATPEVGDEMLLMVLDTADKLKMLTLKHIAACRNKVQTYFREDDLGEKIADVLVVCEFHSILSMSYRFPLNMISFIDDRLTIEIRFWQLQEVSYLNHPFSSKYQSFAKFYSFRLSLTSHVPIHVHSPPPHELPLSHWKQSMESKLFEEITSPVNIQLPIQYM
ncbi:hypothetical protein Smp_096790 [Schistosoma mansoni]|uniref:hypothetical protein n=1 Tax=Schistosoma mansoni TaxID=6183 RepID=UPI00022C81E4|nr:hypothetical protein Smp_096790 [Schistosoma mansoni]|eukprot:XP_018644426.1 hypothetical protein Smp_096790 [Schistosoma mansoni]